MELTWGELAVLFVIGALGGLVGDACHVQTGTTTYLDDTLPFIWESQLWFPVLVGLATASLGELRLRLGPPRQGFDPRVGAGAIAAVLAIYATTSLVYDQGALPSTVLIYTLAFLVVAWLADGWPAIACGLAAAVVGPAVEIAIVELDLAEYAGTADQLGGVPYWLPALYLAFGVVAARLAELIVSGRSAQPPSSSSSRSGSSRPS